MTERPKHDPDMVRDISEAVYRRRLMDAGGKDEPDRMIAKDGDSGEKLRNRAKGYDVLTRHYLDVLAERSGG